MILWHVLTTLKTELYLGEQTELHPKTANLTRWSSTYNMLIRYMEIEQHIRAGRFPSSLTSKFLDADDFSELQQLIARLQDFHFISLKLQEENTTMAFTSGKFDKLILKVPSTASHLEWDSNIVQSLNCNEVKRTHLILMRDERWNVS